MSDGIMLVFGEDGVAREYDDTWDITIHCESEEEQKAVWEKLYNLNREVKNLTDTISRQAAIEAAIEAADEWDCGHSKDRDRTIRWALLRLPSAQQEIIHCCECKHYYYADNRIPQEQRYTCDLDGDRWSADSFCSFAERREE